MDYNPKPFKEGYLPEQDGHRIYFAQYGNPKGASIVVLHGGPGSRSRSSYASTYDLNLYHVILFDQRGCGKSEPQGSLVHNTTRDLVADIERLRKYLHIESWFVAGSSWGSTLALVYAESHPSVVRGLLISSIFLSRRQDYDWSFTKSGGVDHLFPDLWENRLQFLKKFEATVQDSSKVLLAKMQSSDQDVIAEITAGVMNWEGNLMSSQTNLSFVEPGDITQDNINEVKVFLHYESNDSFLENNQILKDIAKIKNIPSIIVHGRHDILCTLDQMWDLQKNLINSEYVILPSSNHKLTADGSLARKYAYQYFLGKKYE